MHHLSVSAKDIILGRSCWGVSAAKRKKQPWRLNTKFSALPPKKLRRCLSWIGFSVKIFTDILDLPGPRVPLVNHVSIEFMWS
jgi:hypothetical protein